MEKLDKIELTYNRVPAIVKHYDGTIVPDSFVYVQKSINDAMHPGTVDSPPSERYIDVLVDGCRQHGVSESHVSWLRSVEFTPRTKPEDFLKIALPDALLPTWTIDDVAVGNGKDGNPIYSAINGKVRQYIGPHCCFQHQIALNSAGKHSELVLSKMLYEPKYGIPEHIEDFSREHCDYLEDMIARSSFNTAESGSPNYIVVALIQQSYSA
jgi:hypothetical protein